MKEGTEKRTAILFDLDGTLWDSSESVVRSWNEVIEEQPDFDKKGTVEDMYRLMGKTMDEIAYAFFDTVSPERALELMQLCSEHENDYIADHGGKLMPKLKETLKELKKDYFLAVVSNCQAGYIEAFLDYHDLRDCFEDYEDFGTTGMKKAENIRLVIERNNLDKVCYVGDIQGDMDASTRAGVSFIHAAYGFGKVPDASYALESFADLPALLQTIPEEFFLQKEES
ncbi:MAG: HAD family hydrolase [Lachnospiraceae bacterium]|nr:HAD family hydrolase [Lachnospiraceae bacterium]